MFRNGAGTISDDHDGAAGDEQVDGDATAGTDDATTEAADATERDAAEQATPPVPERAVEGVKEDIATVKGQR